MCLALSVSKLFDTLMLFPKYLIKVWFRIKLQATKKHVKLTSMQEVKISVKLERGHLRSK